MKALSSWTSNLDLTRREKKRQTNLKCVSIITFLDGWFQHGKKWLICVQDNLFFYRLENHKKKIHLSFQFSLVYFYYLVLWKIVKIVQKFVNNVSFLLKFVFLNQLVMMHFGNCSFLWNYYGTTFIYSIHSPLVILVTLMSLGLLGERYFYTWDSYALYISSFTPCTDKKHISCLWIAVIWGAN